jgi:hypothetical protein
MGNDGLAVDLDERFGQGVASFSKTLTKSGHRNNYLHIYTFISIKASQVLSTH